jgi:hypothetical protein
MNTTYSFQDISCVISHPAMGQHVVTGSGAKTIAISRSNDMSSHDLAADGSVMVSKLASPNGVITVTAQQTSDLHNYLVKLANYVKTAPSDEFASTTIVIRSASMKRQHNCNGVSIQKQPDQTYEASGGTIAWSLMAAGITDEVL